MGAVWRGSKVGKMRRGEVVRVLCVRACVCLNDEACEDGACVCVCVFYVCVRAVLFMGLLSLHAHPHSSSIALPLSSTPSYPPATSSTLPFRNSSGTTSSRKTRTRTLPRALWCGRRINSK